MAANLLPWLILGGVGAAYALTRKQRHVFNLFTMRSTDDVNTINRLLTDAMLNKTQSKPWVLLIGVPEAIVIARARKNPYVSFYATTREYWNDSDRGQSSPVASDQWGIAAMPIIGLWAYDSEGEAANLPVSTLMIDMMIQWAKTGTNPEGSTLGGGPSIL